MAAEDGHLEIVKLLLDHGCDVNDCRRPADDADDAIDWLEIAEQVAVIPLAIFENHDNPEFWQEATTIGGAILDALGAAQLDKPMPPLAYAVLGNKIETARYLVARGAKYDFGDHDMSGYIFLNVMNGDATPETVRFILDHGGKRHCKRRLGATLLNVAIHSRRDLEIVRMLLDAGAPVDGRVTENWLFGDDAQPDVNPLTGHEVKPAIDPLADEETFSISWSGSQPDGLEADTRGWTPLHFAARRGYEEAAQLLMERGADVHARSQVGETPLDLAVPFEQPRPGVDDEFPDEYETGRVVRNKARTAIGELLKTVQAKTPAVSVRR